MSAKSPQPLACRRHDMRFGRSARFGRLRQETGSASVVGQVVAHVGPDDVTQPEVDNDLRLANVPADKRSDEVIKAILSRIIERIVQQALAAKLDREPSVHLDILRSREQALADAYVQRDLGTRASSISKNEVDAYIQAHPSSSRSGKFTKSSRFPSPAEEHGSSRSRYQRLQIAASGRNQAERANIKFSRGTGAMDTATLPPEIQKAIDARKPDDIFFIRSRTSASYFKVTSVEESR